MPHTATLSRLPALLLLLAFLLPAVLLSPPAYAQEVSSIADARAAGEDATVTVEGTVTRAYGDFVRLQDASGATGASGLVVRQTEGPFFKAVQDGTIAPGVTLEVTGTLSAFNGLLQINEGDLTSYTVGEAGEMPTPQDVTLEALTADGEAYESELVRVEGLRLLSDVGTFEADETYTVTDGTATFAFRVQGTSESTLGGTPVPGRVFTYTGVVGQFDPSQPLTSGYQLIPVAPTDLAVQPSAGFTGRSYLIAQEDDGALSVTIRAADLGDGQPASVTATLGEGTADAADVSGFTAPATFTLSEGAPTHTLTLTPVDDDEDEGIEYLTLVLESDDVATAPARFTVWIADGPAATTSLYPDTDGTALLDQLRADYGSASTLGYDVARDTLYAVVYNEEGIVRGFYTGAEATLDGGDPSQDVFDEDINTEHTWPQSLGAGDEPARSDLHILVPAREDVNEARSNYPYADVPDADTDRWFANDETRTTPPDADIDAYSEVDDSPSDRDARRFEPRETVKGDVARKLLYFRTVYPDRADLGFFGLQVATLLQWNDDDPPSAEEVRRNILAASYQGHTLNPYVLDPSLARRAFDVEATPIPIAEARAAGEGATVTIAGTVTRAYGAYARLQDASGATGASALVIRQTDGASADAFQSDVTGGTIRPGTELRLTGTLTAFGGVLQINNGDLQGYQVLDQGDVPEPQNVTLDDLATGGEDYESELVRVEGLTFPDASGSFSNGTSYTVADGDGATLTFRVQNANETALGGASIPAEAFTYTGVVGEFEDSYQLIPVRPGDLRVAPDVPAEIAVDVTRTFGAPDRAESYRLVALPGAADLPLAETIAGTPGTDWQAYRDDGAETDFFVPYTSSDAAFRFAPGAGFWLIAEAPWAVERTVPTVALDEDGAAAVPLRDGWNIVSNPLDVDVAWSAVEAANGVMLQPLWDFTGSFATAETFATAASGRAYYFLNDQGLEALTIPYPTDTEAAARPAADAEAPAAALRLTAAAEGERPAAPLRLRLASDGADGLDAHDWVAPSSPAEGTRLLAAAPGTPDGRRAWLLQETRPDRGAGQTFTLELRTTPGTPVTIRAAGVEALGAEAVVLLDVASGREVDLHATPRVTLTPSEAAAPLQLLAGTRAYVEQAARDALPDRLVVHPNYPNPFHRATHLRYVLPEARTVRATVYDLLGRRVRVLVDEPQRAGPHTLTWAAQGDAQALPSGIYLLHLQAGDEHHVTKVTLLR